MSVSRLVVASLFVAILPFGAFAQQEQAGQQQPPPTEQAPGAAQQEMAPKCRQMVEKAREMNQKMQQSDQKLEQLVSKMNTATGQQKVDAMGEVVNHLIQERKMVREAMEQGPAVVGHMCEHMGQMIGKNKEAIQACCPMMMRSKDRQTTPPASGAKRQQQHH